MKVLITSDSFKGSYSSFEVNQMILDNLKERFFKWDFLSEEISDGGEGWSAIIQKKLQLKAYLTFTIDPIGRPIEGSWLWDSTQKTAYIEMAVASGLTLLSSQERNPWKASSFGTGILINEALKKDAAKIVLGLGGTATNDAGAGILESLGVDFFDHKGQLIKNITPEKFQEIQYIHSNLHYSHTSFELATDVKNPLLGKSGATYIFAAQKGANKSDLESLEIEMEYILSKYQSLQSNLDATLPGMGAAGGVAAGIATIFPCTFTTGFDVIANLTDIEKKIIDADIIITGEGKTDASSLLGKAPVRIAQLAKKYNKKTVLISGSVDTMLYSQLHSLFDIIIPLKKSNQLIEDTISNTPLRIQEYLQKISL
jgi:glycerate kinase